MTREQRIVAVGAASGAAAMLLSLFLLFTLLPPSAAPADATARFTLATKWSLVAALPLLLMVAAISSRRFLSQAIDPTLGREDKRIGVDRRVAANTVEQLMLFLPGSLALAPALPPDWLPIIPSAAIVFAGARLAFWIGYRIDPLFRAFGMAATFYVNIGIVATAVWFNFGSG